MIEGVSFEDAPPAFNRTDYMRTYHAEHREEKKAATRKYRQSKSKWSSNAQYLSRRFVAIDGEGVNRRGRRHDYILLAISDVPPITNRRRLRSMEIFDYLWSHLNSDDINVIYGGSYDFNMWCKDFGRPALAKLYASSWTGPGVKFGPYQLKWMRGKSFSITRENRTVVINDIVSFFQKPFVGACDEYLGGTDLWKRSRELIVREKARRGVFTADELESIAEYNNTELELIIELANELRRRLNNVSLRPRRWNSPGAIAAALFARENVKDHLSREVPEFAARAARFAYFGGRFEVIKYGISHEPAFEYDVNSAYPRALLEVPSLAGASWEQVRGDPGDLPFTVYRVRVTMPRDQGRHEGRHMRIPGPIPCRSENGAICYPMNGETWIWSPEMAMLREYAKAIPGVKFRVLEAVVCHPATDVKPFAFIAALYRQRQALKKAKDGAHVGIKLALNSLYGKTAQQVGWAPATRLHPLRIPPFHQLEWAGYVTSWCRARVMTAALIDPESVIAFETDAVFTTRELPLDIGPDLGQFEASRFRDLTYVQSGHYYGNDADVAVPFSGAIVKCRGIDRGFIDRAAIEAAMCSVPATYEAALTRFYGAGIALARGFETWCTWRREPKVLDLQPSGKRRHDAAACGCGERGGPLESGYWHETYCPSTGMVISNEYPIEWINPNPAMTELEEMRRVESEWEDW